jgi:hypothetical protein
MLGATRQCGGFYFSIAGPVIALKHRVIDPISIWGKTRIRRQAVVGKHPISWRAPANNTDVLIFMFSHNMMKTVFGKVSRSRLYYLLICHLPVRHASDSETGRDALGGVMVVCLLAGMVCLMRFLLTS